MLFYSSPLFFASKLGQILLARPLTVHSFGGNTSTRIMERGTREKKEKKKLWANVRIEYSNVLLYGGIESWEEKNVQVKGRREYSRVALMESESCEEKKAMGEKGDQNTYKLLRGG